MGGKSKSPTRRVQASQTVVGQERKDKHFRSTRVGAPYRLLGVAATPVAFVEARRGAHVRTPSFSVRLQSYTGGKGATQSVVVANGLTRKDALSLAQRTIATESNKVLRGLKRKR